MLFCCCLWGQLGSDSVSKMAAKSLKRKLKKANSIAAVVCSEDRPCISGGWLKAPQVLPVKNRGEGKARILPFTRRSPWLLQVLTGSASSVPGGKLLAKVFEDIKDTLRKEKSLGNDRDFDLSQSPQVIEEIQHMRKNLLT